MYLGDVIWPLGLAIAADAVYALALVPLWWGLREGLAVLEEERLTDKFGAAYTDYCATVSARILPRPKELLAR
jgi:protein-S-isoprenylcysteine O-methyltransferase Ste14